MPTYKSIRGYMKTWSEVTFAQGLDRYFELNKPQNTEWLERTKQTLEEQGLMGRRMDGSCSTGLIKQEGRTRIPFTTVFHNAVDSSFFTPATYSADIVRACMEQGMSHDTTVRELGRALRALPSFIREMDLDQMVSAKIGEAGIKVRNLQDAEVDIKGKTDVYVRVTRANGERQAYRLWSYMTTRRSISNLRSRLMGDRGDLPAGLHLLCPFDSYHARRSYEWYLYPDQTIDEVATIIIENQDPISYAALLKGLDDITYDVTLFRVRA